MPLTLEIVTPEDRVYSDTVDTVVIPTGEGEIGIENKGLKRGGRK